MSSIKVTLTTKGGLLFQGIKEDAVNAATLAGTYNYCLKDVGMAYVDRDSVQVQSWHNCMVGDDFYFGRSLMQQLIGIDLNLRENPGRLKRLLKETAAFKEFDTYFANGVRERLGDSLLNELGLTYFEYLHAPTNIWLGNTYKKGRPFSKWQIRKAYQEDCSDPLSPVPQYDGAYSYVMRWWEKVERAAYRANMQTAILASDAWLNSAPWTGIEHSLDDGEDTPTFEQYYESMFRFAPAPLPTDRHTGYQLFDQDTGLPLTDVFSTVKDLDNWVASHLE